MIDGGRIAIEGHQPTGWAEPIEDGRTVSAATEGGIDVKTPGAHRQGFDRFGQQYRNMGIFLHTC